MPATANSAPHPGSGTLTRDMLPGWLYPPPPDLALTAAGTARVTA